jgi:heat shock protein HslJ
VRRLAVGLLLAMTGCGGAEANPAALREEPWVLTSGLDVDGWEQVAPTATFADRRVTGFTGCNRYGATYTVDGEELRLGPLTATQMACTGVGGEVEQEFTAALERVGRWRVDDERLVLLDGDDEELLRFAVASPVGRWEVTGIRLPDSVSSPLPGTTLTATFDAGGKLSGDAGCNPYTTTYETERGTIEIAEPAGGRRACEQPEGVMEQERAFLAALPTAAKYTLDGLSLSLLQADDTIVATFTKLP